MTAKKQEKTANKSTASGRKGSRKTTTNSRNKTTNKATANKTSQRNKKNKTGTLSIESEILLWVSLAISLFFGISNLGFGGVAGSYVRGIQFGIFGLLAFVFPGILFFGICFVISNKNNKVVIKKVIATLLFISALCMCLELITNFSTNPNIKLSEIYEWSATTKSGGGVLGGLICMVTVSLFDIFGSFLVALLFIIISSILFTEKSLFAFLQRHSTKAYDQAKEDARLRMSTQKEKYQVKRDERILRRRNIVEGVAINTKLETPKPVVSDEVSEVIIPETKVEVVKIEPFSPEFAHMPSILEELILNEEIQQEDIQQEEIQIDEEITIEDLQSTTQELSDEFNQADAIENDQKESIKENGNTIVDKIRVESDSYVKPSTNLLNPVKSSPIKGNTQSQYQTADKLQQTLKNFGVNVTITAISCGPSVTRYEIQPESGVKVSKIVNLADDLKLNLAAADIRIEAPIPGKAAIGIEVPNKETVMVTFRELIESDLFEKEASKIAFVAGKDIGGQVIVTDIMKMPHLLIAGATGSGKSVCINTIIMSILYKALPSEVKLIMIDPKVVELSVYNGIPHLMIPVVTDPKKASAALNWAVLEMTKRYQLFADSGVRDLKGYNQKVESDKQENSDSTIDKLPQIVIIVDELADLMMVAPGEVEESICRLAQLARAAGIHLIIATQRPSVNVITGLIKANMPSRIAFAVTSGVDSRTILDMNGAEKLLGKGDMLFFPQNFSKPQRVQGAFVTDQEVTRVVDFLKEKNEVPAYDQEMQHKMEFDEATSITNSLSEEIDERDILFADVGRFLIESEKGSIGSIQRKFKVGFNRAARIMGQLEEVAVVGPEEGTKPRKILKTKEEFEQFLTETV